MWHQENFSGVVSLVTSEAVLVSNVVLYLLFLVPSVPQRVGRLLPWWEITPEHICCYLGTTLLAQFIVYLLVIPPIVIHIELPTDRLVIGRQMGPHTYVMVGAACLRMLCTCAGAHALILRRTGLSVLGAVQDMTLCEPVYVLGTPLFASNQAVLAQWSARLFLPLLGCFCCPCMW